MTPVVKWVAACKYTGCNMMKKSIKLIRNILTCRKLGDKPLNVIHTVGSFYFDPHEDVDLMEYNRARDEIPQWLYRILQILYIV